MSADVVCACAICRKDITEGQRMADHHVYKLGELAYIELAHHHCASVETDRGACTPDYWKYD